jgi:acyl transferase domain-containing protein
VRTPEQELASRPIISSANSAIVVQPGRMRLLEELQRRLQGAACDPFDAETRAWDAMRIVATHRRRDGARAACRERKGREPGTPFPTQKAADAAASETAVAIAFTFPGQGSQAVGMGKDLADAFPEARAVFDEVDDALGQKLSRLMWEGEGPKRR